MLRRTVSGIMLTLLSIGMFTLAFNLTVAGLDETETIEPVKTAGDSAMQIVDWWPMFHHDLSHTGYSTSTAPNTNNVLWSYLTGGSACYYSSPAIADGRIYFGSNDYKVYCLNASSGASIWSYTTGDWIEESSPTVADGKVYIGSNDRKVYCLNATTGAYIWSYLTGGKIWSSPAVADGRVYVGSLDKKVYCLNATNGAFMWSYTTGDYISGSSPTLVDGKVYIGSNDKKVYCLNAINGAFVWSYTTGDWVTSSPSVVDGRVYVGSGDYKVYCLNATTGAFIWNYTTGYYVWRSPAVAYGKVYIGSQDRKVYCLNATTGAYTWSYTTGNEVSSDPAIADDKVYIGSLDWKLYCLNATTGALIWNYATGDPVNFPAVADGKVYVGSRDWKVYCFGPPPTHTLTITTTAGGTTTPAPGTYTYDAGSSVPVTAIPSTNYMFDHWELDSANIGADNPKSVTMDADHWLHAVFVSALIHDVAVTNVTSSKTVVGQGYFLAINVTVENLGDFNENFNVTLYASTTAIENQTINNMLNGTSAILTFRWNTTGFAKGIYTITVYAEPVINETHTADNTLPGGVVRVAMPGDILEPFGIVDMTDIGWICLAYGAGPGHSRWNPNADITGNDYVDMDDIGYACLNYGKQDP